MTKLIVKKYQEIEANNNQHVILMLSYFEYRDHDERIGGGVKSDDNYVRVDSLLLLIRASEAFDSMIGE